MWPVRMARKGREARLRGRIAAIGPHRRYPQCGMESGERAGCARTQMSVIMAPVEISRFMVHYGLIPR